MVKTVAKKKYNKVRDQRNKYKKDLEGDLTKCTKNAWGITSCNSVNKPSNIIQPKELDTPDDPIKYGGGYIAREDAYKTLYGNYLAGYKHKNDDLNELRTTPLTGIAYAISAANTENKVLQSQLDENTEKYSVDNQKVYYKAQQIQGLKSFNYKLFLIYYFLFLVFAALLITRASSITLLSKLIIIVGFGLYPFLIVWFIQKAVFIYNYLDALFHGKVYEGA